MSVYQNKYDVLMSGVSKGVEVSPEQCKKLLQIMEVEQGFCLDAIIQENGRVLLSYKKSMWDIPHVVFSGSPRATFEFLCGIVGVAICGTPGYISSRYAKIVLPFVRAVCTGNIDEADSIFRVWFNSSILAVRA